MFFDQLQRKRSNRRVTYTNILCDNVKKDIGVAGLKRIADRERHWLQRTIWTFLVILSALLVAYVLYERCSYYITAPMVIDLERVEGIPLEMPAITICQSFRPHYPIGLNGSFEKDLFERIYTWGSRQYFKNNRTFTKAEMKNFNWKTFLKNMWPKVRPNHCMFVSLLNNKRINCDDDDFVYNPVTDLGIEGLKLPCYTIIKPKWIFTRRDKIFILELNKTTPYGESIVYHLAAHQKEEIPEILSESVKIHTSGGRHSPDKFVLRLTRKDIVLNSIHEGAGEDCLIHHHDNLKYYQSYSRGKCTNECFANLTMNSRCGCIIPVTLERYSPDEVCLPQDWNECYVNNSLSFYADSEKRCNCHRLCWQNLYEINVEKSVSRRTGRDEKRHYLRVFIKFKRLTVERIRQRPFLTFYKLIAEIGGILSLGLGVRLLTFLEIWDVLILVSIKACRYRKWLKQTREHKDSCTWVENGLIDSHRYRSSYMYNTPAERLANHNGEICHEEYYNGSACIV